VHPEQASASANRLTIDAGAQGDAVKFIDWRVEIIISSQSMKKVLRPLVLLAFTTGRDEKRRVVMSGDQFSEFRKKLAESIQQLHRLEKMPLMG